MMTQLENQLIDALKMLSAQHKQQFKQLSSALQDYAEQLTQAKIQIGQYAELSNKQGAQLEALELRMKVANERQVQQSQRTEELIERCAALPNEFRGIFKSMPSG